MADKMNPYTEEELEKIKGFNVMNPFSKPKVLEKDYIPKSIKDLLGIYGEVRCVNPNCYSVVVPKKVPGSWYRVCPKCGRKQFENPRVPTYSLDIMYRNREGQK